MTFPGAVVIDRIGDIKLEEDGFWPDSIQVGAGARTRNYEFEDGSIEEEKIGPNVPSIRLTGRMNIEYLALKNKVATTVAALVELSTKTDEEVQVTLREIPNVYDITNAIWILKTVLYNQTNPDYEHGIPAQIDWNIELTYVRNVDNAS